MNPLATIVLRLALCAAVIYLVSRVFGLFAVVFGAPLVGVALARPLQELVADAAGSAKRRALEDVQGRYFSYRGTPVDIAEDEEAQRWLLVRDARKVVPGLARDEVLQRLFPGRAGALESARGLRIRADALAEHLRSAQDPAAVKFKVWLEREVLRGKSR